MEAFDLAKMSLAPSYGYQTYDLFPSRVLSLEPGGFSFFPVEGLVSLDHPVRSQVSMAVCWLG